MDDFRAAANLRFVPAFSSGSGRSAGLRPTQDVFLKAYQALIREDAKDLEDPARWVTRIAVNTCLDRLRSKKWQFWRRRPSSEDEQAILGMAASTAPDAERRYFASEVGARLDAALGKLSPRQRAVFTLRHFEDMSLEEIGVTLGLWM